MLADTLAQRARGFPRRALRSFLIATGFAAAALILTFPVQLIISRPFNFLFFACILLSAWFGGMLSGFIAVVESAFLIAYFFLSPAYSLNIGEESQSYLAIFIICSSAVTFVGTARKQAEEILREARDELEDKVRSRTVELERSNLEIRESERQLRRLTEALPQQIWRANTDGMVEYCNRYLCEYAGAASDTLQGEDFFRIVHPQDAPAFRAAWSKAIATGSNLETEIRVRGGKGEHRWFLVRSVPQLAENGTILSWYGTHIDVEQQRQAQHGLAQAQEQLDRLARTMGMAEMAASIAHELNQPLTALVMHANACRQWLRGDPANIARATDTAEKMVQESVRASAVVGRVRALFQKEAQVRVPSDINRIVESLGRLLRDESIRRGVEVVFQPEKNLPLIPLDPVQIEQLMLNLARNAMEAMEATEAPHRILIRTARQSDDEVRVEVEDSGHGVSPELSAQIFDGFFTTKPQGTGMGLTICRSIVEAHNGRLWVSASPAGGAVFQFTLRAMA